jgi:hypothetical protein
VPESVNSDPEFSLKNAKLYTETTAPLGIASELESLLERYAYEGKLRHFGVDPAVVTQAKSEATVEAFELSEEGSEASGAEIKSGIGFVGGILIYLFTFCMRPRSCAASSKKKPRASSKSSSPA